MTGLYVSIIFTCTHRTHRTLYPQLLERKNMDALYFFGLQTSHTLPTSSCKKKYRCYLCFSPAHTAHTAHSTHSFLKEKIWMLSIFFACTHCTKYPQHLARKKYGCHLLFSPAHTARTAHSTH